MIPKARNSHRPAPGSDPGPRDIALHPSRPRGAPRNGCARGRGVLPRQATGRSAQIRAACILVLLTLAPIEAAYAQAYSCYRPAELRVPSGYTVTERQREDLVRDAATYLADMQTYAECLRAEHEHAMDELDEVADRIERMDEEVSRR